MIKMQIALYNNTSARNVVKKIKSNVKTVNGQLTENTSIENPSFIIEYFNDINFNYVYVPTFGRYYFIDNFDVNEGQNIVLHCSVDALSSFWNSIKNSPCIAKRSASNFSNAIEDNEVLKKSTSQYIFRKLNVAFTPTDGAGNYILTLGGGN